MTVRIFIRKAPVGFECLALQIATGLATEQCVRIGYQRFVGLAGAGALIDLREQAGREREPVIFTRQRQRLVCSQWDKAVRSFLRYSVRTNSIGRRRFGPAAVSSYAASPRKI